MSNIYCILIIHITNLYIAGLVGGTKTDTKINLQMNS